MRCIPVRHGASSVRSEFDCVCVPAGTDIFHRGDAATCAYLIEEGEVRIWVPDEGGPGSSLCSAQRKSSARWQS